MEPGADRRVGREVGRDREQVGRARALPSADRRDDRQRARVRLVVPVRDARDVAHGAAIRVDLGVEQERQRRGPHRRAAPRGELARGAAESPVRARGEIAERLQRRRSDAGDAPRVVPAPERSGDQLGHDASTRPDNRFAGGQGERGVVGQAGRRGERRPSDRGSVFVGAAPRVAEGTREEAAPDGVGD